MQGMGIAPWAKLFHTTKEKVNCIIGVHEFFYYLPPNAQAQPPTIWSALLGSTPLRN
jgi:hypothetical protein